jgi:uncharacterized protein YxjI
LIFNIENSILDDMEKINNYQIRKSENKIMFCPNCGKGVEKDQKFCEKCGTEIDHREEVEAPTSQIQQSSSQVSMPTPPSTVADGKGLFDLSRDYYVIRETIWDLGEGEIYDEKGNIIGLMHRKILSVRRRVKLKETDGETVAVIHQKLLSARGANDLFDPEGNLIARIKKKILAVMHPKFWLEDPSGKRWYEARGNLFGWSFTITDLTDGKVIAQIEKADKWRDVFLGGIFDFSDTYALKILDHETDRRILLGFVLSIDNVMHDNPGSAMGAFMWGGRHRGGKWGPKGKRSPGPFGRKGPWRFRF